MRQRRPVWSGWGECIHARIPHLMFAADRTPIQRGLCSRLLLPRGENKVATSFRPKLTALLAIVFGERLVDPTPPVVAAPHLAHQQSAGDRAARNDHLPEMPDLGPGRHRAQAQHSRPFGVIDRHQQLIFPDRAAQEMTARRLAWNSKNEIFAHDSARPPAGNRSLALT